MAEAKKAGQCPGFLHGFLSMQFMRQVVSTSFSFSSGRQAPSEACQHRSTSQVEGKGLEVVPLLFFGKVIINVTLKVLATTSHGILAAERMHVFTSTDDWWISNIPTNGRSRWAGPYSGFPDDPRTSSFGTDLGV